MTKSTNEIKAVIFDMDGTLFDTEQVYQRAWRGAGAQLNFSDVEQALNDCTGRNMVDTRAYFEQHYAGTVDFDAFAAARDAIYEDILLNEGLTLKPGVVQTLQWLQDHGILIALGTSTFPPRVMKNMEQSGLETYFKTKVMGNMVKQGKPHPETFLMAAELLGVAPENCMGVEDSFNGVRAIHAAGMFTVMVPDLFYPNEELLPMIDAVCDTLLDIQPIVAKINRIS